MSAPVPRPPRGIVYALKRFAALPTGRRGIALEAVVTLGVARILILTVPVRWIVRRLDRQPAVTPSNPAADQLAREVGWAVRAAASKTPWQSACLAQAVAGKWMLGQRGIRSTIRLGVARDADGKLQAHAWLCADALVLTGGERLTRFTPLGDLD